MEALKYRVNKGRDGGVFFYRDSNKNEVDLLIKEEGEISAFEIKSSQTYSLSFEDALKKLPRWIQSPVKRRGVVYAGDFENTSGQIEVINYRNLL